MLVDLITGLPDAPVVSEKDRASFMSIDVQNLFTDIKITEKNGLYSFSCFYKGKKMPKKTLTAEEAAWLDYGVAGGRELAARLYVYQTIHSVGGDGFSGKLF